jgi:hypothetical protein
MVQLRLNGFSAREAWLLGLAHEVDAPPGYKQKYGKANSNVDTANNRVGLAVAQQVLDEGKGLTAMPNPMMQAMVRQRFENRAGELLMERLQPSCMSGCLDLNMQVQPPGWLASGLDD